MLTLFFFVRNYFPVWRELKHKNETDHHSEKLVRNYFPVWRELKLTAKTYSSDRWCSVRNYFPVWRELKLQNFDFGVCCQVCGSERLSRWKGMDWLSVFGCQQSEKRIIRLWSTLCQLHIRLSSWTELEWKMQGWKSGSMKNGSGEYFPVGRNWDY